MATFAGALVTGSLSAAGAGTRFQPIQGKSFNVFITGTFVGTVEVQRSFDGVTFVTLSPPDLSAVAVFTAPGTFVITEPVASALYQINCTDYSSGTINYRMES